MKTQYSKRTDLLENSYTLLIELNLDKRANIFRVGYNTMNYDSYFIRNSW